MYQYYYLVYITLLFKTFLHKLIILFNKDALTFTLLQKISISQWMLFFWHFRVYIKYQAFQLFSTLLAWFLDHMTLKTGIIAHKNVTLQE